MPSIKEYNNKIQSLKNTRKMTKTMKMVSASKLRKAQEAQRNGKPYADQLRELVSRLAASAGAGAHPLLASRPAVKNVLLLVMTSDKGLCGAFNHGVIKFVDRWREEHRGRFENIHMAFCARRGFAYYRKRLPVWKYFEGATARPSFVTSHAIATELIRAFLKHEVDEVYLMYNTFRSALTQKPVAQKILPIEPEEVLGHGAAFSADYIFEPALAELLEGRIARTISFKVYYALLENAAGEHGARMTAMDNATSNADNLIDRYTLLRNRARQSAITTELIEIVSGAEAL